MVLIRQKLYIYDRFIESKLKMYQMAKKFIPYWNHNLLFLLLYSLDSKILKKKLRICHYHYFSYQSRTKNFGFFIFVICPHCLILESKIATIFLSTLSRQWNFYVNGIFRVFRNYESLSLDNKFSKIMEFCFDMGSC